MNMPSLLDAVRVVKENERLASESYANAAKTTKSLARKVYEQLSEFEQYHYDRLTALEKSLEETGDFIDYQGREFFLPPRLEIKFVEEPDPKSMLDVVSEAMKVEKQAEAAYADLAKQLTDPRGHEMFARLAKEERIHYDILKEVFYSMNQTGVWKWTRPDLKD